MYKIYKFRIYPCESNKQIIDKTISYSRFVYNYFLSKMLKEGYVDANINIKYFKEHLLKDYIFLKEVSIISLIKIIYVLDNNYKASLRNGGKPKFKSHFGKNCYYIPIINNTFIKIDFYKRYIKLPYYKPIRFKAYESVKNINGKINLITISIENGKYYINISYNVEESAKVNPASIIGIDIGIKKLLTLSDGNSFDNNKYIFKYEKRINQMQKRLSKKKKGSNNYYKCRFKLDKLYSRLSKTRKRYIHKITSLITNEYDIIICEKLHIKKMIENGKNTSLSKKINDATFNEIIKQLEYKSKLKGKYFYQICDYYPSSQICSVCGNRANEYKDLSKREYICHECNLELDRDLNASINIMFEGLKLFMNNNVK